MAKQFYQLSGSDLLVWDDPQNLSTQAEIQSRIDALTPFQQLADGSRELLAQGGVPGAGIPGGFSDLASFDTWLTDEIERLQDIRDYYDYSTKQETIGNVRDGAWWTPEAVESVSDEGVSPAVNALDGVGSTFWETDQAPASIIFRLRSYRKNVESIRLWTPNNMLKTFLNGITVRASQGLGMIDDASNVMASNISIQNDGDAWSDIVFANPNNPTGRKRCRYIKLDIPGSQHAQDVIQIRRIEARVVIFNHET